MNKSGLLRIVGYSSVLAAAIALAGCLGDGGDQAHYTAPVAPTAAVPTSASASVGGFISYLEALIASPADTLSPVDTTNVTAPTNDTIEPAPIT